MTGPADWCWSPVTWYWSSRSACGCRRETLAGCRCRGAPDHRATGMSRLPGAGRSVTSRPAGTGDHLGPVPPGRALPIGVGHRFPGTGVCRSGGWLSRWDTCLMSVPGWPGCRAGAGHRTYPHELMNGERLCGSGLGIKECLGDQEVYDDRRRVRERNCY